MSSKSWNEMTKYEKRIALWSLGLIIISTAILTIISKTSSYFRPQTFSFGDTVIIITFFIIVIIASNHFLLKKNNPFDQKKILHDKVK